jgi:hypothetical protein
MKQVGIKIAVTLANVAPTAVEAPHILVIGLPPTSNWVADECDTPETREKIALALQKLLKRPVSIRFDRASDESVLAIPAASGPVNHREKLEGDPMVQKVIELFDARPFHLEAEEG